MIKHLWNRFSSRTSYCKRVNPFLLMGILLCLLSGWLPLGKPASGQENGIRKKPVMVHYMPWFASKKISGEWGWHWTMGKTNPDRTLPNGFPDAACHDLPLIGLYDSSDPDLLEYHVQLMKLSGIDGVIIDWYGVSDFRDYGVLHQNTQKLIQILARSNLKFAICYEDQSLKHRITSKRIDPDGKTDEATRDLNWVRTNCFPQTNYLKIRNRPALFVFGPQSLTGEEWDKIRTSIEKPMVLLTLPHLVKNAKGDGPFGWIPVTGGKRVKPEDWKAYIESLRTGFSKKPVSGIAFPGFHDFYQEAGLHPSYGRVDERNGDTFSETLDLNQRLAVDLVQIATWNDFGEGTAIEPSQRLKYRYLELLQKHPLVRSGFTSSDLRLPARIYRARKTELGPENRELLRSASNELLMGNPKAAARLLDQNKPRKK